MIDTFEGLYQLKEENLAYSLLSIERSKVLKEVERLSEYDTDNISNWVSFKSLVKENEFRERLSFEEIDEKDFNLGIKDLSEEDKSFLLKYVKESEWFKYFEKSMHLFDEVDESIHKNGGIKEYNLSYIIRPYLYMLQKHIVDKINSLNNFKITESALQQLMNTCTTKLIHFYNKVFIIEINSAKEHFELEGNNGEERFEFFIKTFFKSKDQLLRFYYKYPVLTRLATTKMKFLLDFIIEALDNLDNNYENIKELYPDKDLKIIDQISASEGDSHEKGKSVIIFGFKNDIKLVYKPRDLRIIKAYNEFVDWINNNSGLLDIAKTIGIYKENYSFERFVEYNHCYNEQQIKNYYRRFGNIVAVAHILCANDLHLENLIASGEYPTIIDLETIIQVETQLNIFEKERASTLVKQSVYINSLPFTGLLPNNAFSNNKEGKGVDLSALNGKTSKLPFKILSPINMNTDEYKLELQEYVRKGGNNIPILNGKPVYFSNYKNEIYLGFYEMMNFFMTHKEDLIGSNGKLKIFKGCLVRNVLKATQMYMSMLQYSNHPNYSKDMLRREKLIENIWAYPHKNKELIKYEYKDMMFDDIPVFFSYVDNKDIVSSDKKIIKDYFPESGLSKVEKRIKDLDLVEIQRQKTILEVTLGKYDEVIEDLKGTREYLDSKYTNIDILNEAKEIGDFIIAKGVYSEGGGQITWADITMNGTDKTRWEVTNIDCSLYDGLSGVALFLLELYGISKEDRYYKAYEKAMLEAISNADFEKTLSAYAGKVSILFPILNEIQKNGKSKFKYYIEDIKKFIKENINNIKEVDWLLGLSGLIALMINAYEILDDDEFLNIAKQMGINLCKNIKIHDFKNIGYGHGCSGIVIALHRLFKYYKNEDFINKANELIQRERELIEGKEYKEQYKWCWGTTGIGLSRLELYENYKEEIILSEIKDSVDKIKNVMKKDDCICHGNMADIELLYQYSKLLDAEHDLAYKKLIDVYSNKLNNKYYSIRRMPEFDSVSLFTGLSGIGYQMLRLYDPSSISNVLILKVGK